MKRKRALLIAFVLCITFGLTACQDVENDAVKPMDIVEKFFLAFEVSDYKTMKKYCTESCIETYFHEGNVDACRNIPLACQRRNCR